VGSRVVVWVLHKLRSPVRICLRNEVRLGSSLRSSGTSQWRGLGSLTFELQHWVTATSFVRGPLALTSSGRCCCHSQDTEPHCIEGNFSSARRGFLSGRVPPYRSILQGIALVSSARRAGIFERKRQSQVASGRVKGLGCRIL